MSHRASKKPRLETNCDVFPNTVSGKVKPLPDILNFQKFSCRYKISAYEMYIDGTQLPISKIHYDQVKFDMQRQTHFNNIGKRIRDSRPHEKMKQWPNIYKKLINGNSKSLTNINQRTFFQMERNYFTVPKGFTFGVRTVERGTGHVYLTHNIPLEFYQLRTHFKNHIQWSSQMFNPSHQSCFYHKRLRANCKYWVPEGTTYVITVLEPAFFAVHLVADECRANHDFQNPLLEEEVSESAGVCRVIAETPNVSAERFERYVPTDPVLLAGPVTVETPNVLQERYVPSDPVLLSFESGRDLRMSNLSPDPPPPVVTVGIIKPFPMERTVQVVAPDFISWYDSVFRNKMYDNPKQYIEQHDEPMDLTGCGEPMDLTGCNKERSEQQCTERDSIGTKTMTPGDIEEALDELESRWRNEPLSENVYY